MSVLCQNKCVFVCVSQFPLSFIIAEQSKEQIPVRSVFTNMETSVRRLLTCTEWETLSG